MPKPKRQSDCTHPLSVCRSPAGPSTLSHLVFILFTNLRWPSPSAARYCDVRLGLHNQPPPLHSSRIPSKSYTSHSRGICLCAVSEYVYLKPLSTQGHVCQRCYSYCSCDGGFLKADITGVGEWVSAVTWKDAKHAKRMKMRSREEEEEVRWGQAASYVRPRTAADPGHSGDSHWWCNNSNILTLGWTIWPKKEILLCFVTLIDC